VFEVGNLLTVSEALTRSARHRTESRGAHSRLDHPDTDDANWGNRNTVIRHGRNDRMEVRTTALPAMPAALRELLSAAH